MDSVLALIPVFVVLATISTISHNPSSPYLSMERLAQDSMEVLLIGTEYTKPMLKEFLLDLNESEICSLLNKTLPNYMLVMKNETSSWIYVCGNAGGNTEEASVKSSMEIASDVVTAERIAYNKTNGNITMYTFKIKVWR
jgi:hypothetical protein